MKKHKIRHEALKELSAVQIKHVNEIIELRSKLSEIAIVKSETAMLERMESSNNKFGLLKEQAGEFATKKDIINLTTQFSTLSKIVYIGIGIVLVLEILLKYLIQ